MINFSQSRTLMMHRISFKNDFCYSESESFSPPIRHFEIGWLRIKFLNAKSSTGKPLILKKLWCLYLLIVVIYLLVLVLPKITDPRFELNVIDRYPD